MHVRQAKSLAVMHFPSMPTNVMRECHVWPQRARIQTYVDGHGKEADIQASNDFRPQEEFGEDGRPIV